MIVFAGEAGERVCRALDYRHALDAVDDPRGTTVRATPQRWTLMQTLSSPVAGGVVIFRKVRVGGVAAAEREWHWLHALPRYGLQVAGPAFFARAGERSVVATFAAPGRPLAALLAEVDQDAASAYACGPVVATVRRLHAAGLVFRDLYWNHLFAVDLDAATAPTFIDVERVLRPRLMWRRWLVKDLAGLVAGWPFAADRDFAPRLAVAYDAAAATWLARRVEHKARRIRRHAPKYGN